jgi:hypothetical protein
MDLEKIKSDAIENFEVGLKDLKIFSDVRQKKVYANKKNCLLNFNLKERVHLSNKSGREDLVFNVFLLPGNRILIELAEGKK